MALGTNTVNTSVTRTRRYLTGREVERLIEAARKHGRYGHRDATMILIAYRHGLRASELCDLQWHQVELNAGRLLPGRWPRRALAARGFRRLCFRIISPVSVVMTASLCRLSVGPAVVGAVTTGMGHAFPDEVRSRHGDARHSDLRRARLEKCVPMQLRAGITVLGQPS